jgi:multiple sugar transport system substrate-binding protein
MLVAACGGGAPATQAPAAPEATEAAAAPAEEATEAPAAEAAAEEATAEPTEEAAAEPAATAEASETPVVLVAPAEVMEGRIPVRWYVGLGSGTDPAQIEVQQKVVDDFNKSQDKIQLILEIITYNAARDTLATQIASGNGPDIIGPVGGSGSNSFYGQWLDLKPLIEKSGYDLSQFGESSVNFFITEEGQVGLPFASFPSMTYYQREMFDEAGLNYPPDAYGKPYVMPGGKEVEWNYDTLTNLAKVLTVDTDGNSPLEIDENDEFVPNPDFDATKIVQYGYVPQYQDPRAIGSFWSPGRLVADDGKTAQIPDAWAKAWQWYYDGMWGDQPFIPTFPVIQSPEFGTGNPYNSGKVAMALTHLWYTCCIGDAGESWDVAAVPSYEGTTTANLNADTFRVWKGTKNPEAAFEVLSYLVGEGSLDLLSVYGGMPARIADQDAFFATLDEKYPQGVNWDVAKAGMDYADIPSNEAYTPGYLEMYDRVNTFNTKLQSEDGLDVAAETAQLQADLQTIYDKALANQ